MVHLLLALHILFSPALASGHPSAATPMLALQMSPIGPQDDPIKDAPINFPGLKTGLGHLIGDATGVLTGIAVGFFGLLIGLACLAYAWNHNNPRKLQESRTAIMRILEAAALFWLISVILGLVHTIVGYASHV